MHRLYGSMIKKIVIVFILFGVSGTVLAYTTKIENATGMYIEQGYVSLAWCSGDAFQIDPNSNWSRGRGACLLTRITAKVCGVDRSTPCVEAEAYSSSGTAYEKFIIKTNGKGGYVITRP